MLKIYWISTRGAMPNELPAFFGSIHRPAKWPLDPPFPERAYKGKHSPFLYEYFAAALIHGAGEIPYEIIDDNALRAIDNLIDKHGSMHLAVSEVRQVHGRRGIATLRAVARNLKWQRKS